MDDLEFRRNIVADPNLIDSDMEAALADDGQKRELLTELKQLNHKIAEASKIGVPEGLAHRLLLRQSMAAHREKQQRRKYYAVAMAASLLVAVLVSYTTWKPVNDDAINIVENSIEHVLHEGAYALATNENIDLQQVNGKLARFGGEFIQQPGQIYYANFCDFNRVKSLHLVMQGEHGKVSIFIIPNQHAYAMAPVAQHALVTEVIEMREAIIVLVSELSSELAPMSAKLSNSIKFST